MQVDLWSIDQVKPYERNPRINDGAVEAVAKSLREYGWRQPIVVDAEGVIIVGHTRWKAAKKLGFDKVPVHVATDLSADKIRAYRIADNQTATIAEWDLDLLPIELSELQAADYDLGLLGFDADELARIMGSEAQDGLCDPDEVPLPPEEAVTQPGDLWILGDHRLLTSRVVVITEVDGMDQPGATSRESDKITQLEARTRAYGSRKRIYMECTVSTEAGRTWQEYTNGTRSRIVLPCPHCGAWVTPEREQLVDWQDAASQREASAAAQFECPQCQAPWDHTQRVEANTSGRLVHEGQQVEPDGTLTGPAPHTSTFGLRWSAVNNLFLTAGDLAADEWRAARAADEENAERELRQFVWCLPVAPAKFEQTTLEIHTLAGRMLPLARGVAPQTATTLTVAMDLGKYLTHWIAVAWSPGASGQVVDYGRLEVASDELGVEQALLVAMREFRDLVQAGWEQEGVRHVRLQPAAVWIDAGYMTPTVYAFCREAGELFHPSVGRGADQQRQQWYNRPTQTGSVVRHIGEGFHLNYVRNERLYLAEVDSDHWKTWVHERLNTPVGTPGALTLFSAPPNTHLALAKHLTAEAKTEEFVAGRGLRVKWERIRKQNHWLDALYNACAAGHYAGVRLVVEKKQLPYERPTLQQLAQGKGSWFANATYRPTRW